MPEGDLQKLNGQENGVVGMLSGVIEVTLLQPMLFLKNASQQGLKITLDPRILYRGLTMSITNMGVLTGLQFPLTNAVRNAFTGGEVRKLTNSELVSSSFIGGAISGLVCGPMELVMIQQQRFGGSVVATPARLASAFGVASFMRGVTMACGREGLFTAGYLGLGPTFSRELRERYASTFTEFQAKIIGSIGAGLIAATLSHPMDTIKTCMQGDIEKKKFTSLTGTAKVLFAEGGYSRFLHGWGWRTLRMMCAIYIFSECQNRLPRMLFPARFKEQ